jgi:hypothetical protein
LCEGVVDALGFNVQPAKHPWNDLTLGSRTYERNRYHELAR